MSPHRIVWDAKAQEWVVVRLRPHRRPRPIATFPSLLEAESFVCNGCPDEVDAG